MPDHITTLSRDPFARCETLRRTIPDTCRGSCLWCGSGLGRFEYWVEADAHPVRVEVRRWRSYLCPPRHIPGWCSVDCWRAYVETWGVR